MKIIHVVCRGKDPFPKRANRYGEFKIGHNLVLSALESLCECARSLGYQKDVCVPLALRIRNNLVFKNDAMFLMDHNGTEFHGAYGELRTFQHWQFVAVVIVDEKRLPVEFVRKLFKVAGRKIGLRGNAQSGRRGFFSVKKFKVCTPYANPPTAKELGFREPGIPVKIMMAALQIAGRNVRTL